MLLETVRAPAVFPPLFAPLKKTLSIFNLNVLFTHFLLVLQIKDFMPSEERMNNSRK